MSSLGFKADGSGALAGNFIFEKPAATEAGPGCAPEVRRRSRRVPGPRQMLRSGRCSIQEAGETRMSPAAAEDENEADDFGHEPVKRNVLKSATPGRRRDGCDGARRRDQNR